MRTASNDWWRQLGAMTRGLLFLDGHIVPGDTATPHAEPVPRPRVRALRRECARRILIARRIRQLPALSLFR